MYLAMKRFKYWSLEAQNRGLKPTNRQCIEKLNFDEKDFFMKKVESA